MKILIKIIFLLYIILPNFGLAADLQAKFTITSLHAAAPLTINLDASESTAASNNSVVDYEWSINNGSSFFGNPASYTFKQHGSYEIKLIVKDNNAASSELTKTLYVKARPIAHIKVQPYEYVWVFPQLVQLDGSQSYDPDGSIMKYEWLVNREMINGKRASASINTIDDSITLTVTDNDGLKTSINYTINTNNNPPVADFTYTVTPEKGPVPFTVSLDASNSTDDGEISSYEWKSSDGQTASGKQAELIFPKEGEYTITLTVTDDQDATAESTEILNLESWVPEFIYNSTARAYPQVIAAGVSPSKIDAFDDSEFDIVALVRPGVLPIKKVSFEKVEETQSVFGGLKRAMTLAGVLANGDEIYKFTYKFERGQIKDFVLETIWGSKVGQFNIVAKDDTENRPHTFPYLMVGNYPIQKAKTQSEKPVNYNKTKRFGPQMIMAGYSPAKLDYSDEEFDLIAVVRVGELPIKQVILKNNSGAFDSKMEQAGELSNGDKIYKTTFTYPRGALGRNEPLDYKDLWGPDASQFGIEVIDQAEQRSHKFPNVEFGNFPAMK